MAIQKFEDIIAWQKSKILVAEGYERRGDKELKHFLFIAKRSCGELRSMLYIAEELKYISEQEFTNFYNACVELSKLLSGFIKSLNVALQSSYN